ncbi:LysR family transcriptional regulator [Brevibacterium daeguense]|uniref:LysR family transcriptional regulator n=1 Tax=Brevibacterium daeguense TaxID=909936 RepID=A0ABP8EFK2_9MICO
MSSIDFTFEQLRCFVAVAEELNFGRAANRLSMTQPPLSRQIQRLEKTLGVELLIRDRRTVQLTPSGETFLADCYATLAMVRTSVERLHTLDDEYAGTIRSGFTGVGTYRVLPDLMRAVATELPKVKLEVAERVSPIQTELIRQGTLDIGYIRPQELPEGVEHRVMSDEPLVAVMAEDHPLACAQGPLTPEVIARTPVIRYEEEGAPYLSRVFDGVFDQFRPEVNVEISQAMSGAALAAAGFGCVLAPVSVLKLGFEGLVARRVRLPEEHSTLPLWTIFSSRRAGPLMFKLLEISDRVARHVDDENRELIEHVR